MPARRIGRKQLDAGGINAPHVLTTDRKAMAIEKLKDLDRDLATVIKAITELRRRESAFRSMGGDVDGDFRHRLHLQAS